MNFDVLPTGKDEILSIIFTKMFQESGFQTMLDKSQIRFNNILWVSQY